MKAPVLKSIFPLHFSIFLHRMRQCNSMTPMQGGKKEDSPPRDRPFVPYPRSQTIFTSALILTFSGLSWSERLLFSMVSDI